MAKPSRSQWRTPWFFTSCSYSSTAPSWPGITVEQFVENYNQARAFELGKNNMAYRLTVDGTFEEVPRPSETGPSLS